MDVQSKKKSLWGSFKNTYLRPKNLKNFWKNLRKDNLSKDLIDTLNLYINSESYKMSSKYWRHLTINQLGLLANKKYNDKSNLIAQEYFTFSYINDSLIQDTFNNIKNSKIKIDVNLFKKQDNFTISQSINHNIILLMLYENIKNKKIFNLFKSIKKNNNPDIKTPSLNINGTELTQDELNSLFEYEEIEKLLDKIKNKDLNFLEIGSGEGRTAKMNLLLNKNIKRYVIADIPPAINYCFNNLKSTFPEKKISTAFNINNEKDLLKFMYQNDVMFIFPHQLNYFSKKTFDISIAIDCLHEMEKNIIKEYMNIFELTSRSLYFKVWEKAGLPYSFNKHYSVHNKDDYFIKDAWKEHLKQRCLYPSNYFQLGYEF
jgi:putative sugar O-methyltransferase|tara:strand:+ start:1029 stop:2147 length:1119 start_codon:yes stop_codon:yes gene_type:complete